MKVKKFNEHNSVDTLVVSAFPGCGKSHLFRNKGDKTSLQEQLKKISTSIFLMLTALLMQIKHNFHLHYLYPWVLFQKGMKKSLPLT